MLDAASKYSFSYRRNVGELFFQWLRIPRTLYYSILAGTSLEPNISARTHFYMIEIEIKRKNHADSLLPTLSFDSITTSTCKPLLSNEHGASAL